MSRIQAFIYVNGKKFELDTSDVDVEDREEFERYIHEEVLDGTSRANMILCGGKTLALSEGALSNAIITVEEVGSLQ